MFLSDLTKIDEGNSTFLNRNEVEDADLSDENRPTKKTEENEHGMINLPKFKLMHSIAYNLLLHQKASKKLEKEEPLHSLLFQLPCLLEDELLDMSMHVQTTHGQ